MALIFSDLQWKELVLCFNDGIHPLDLAQFLNEGKHSNKGWSLCSTSAVQTRRDSIARISFYIYNNEKDIDKFCESFKN